MLRHLLSAGNTVKCTYHGNSLKPKHTIWPSTWVPLKIMCDQTSHLGIPDAELGHENKNKLLYNGFPNNWPLYCLVPWGFFQWCFYICAALTAHVCTFHDGFNQTQETVLGTLLLSEILFKFLFLRWKAFLLCLIM